MVELRRHNGSTEGHTRQPQINQKTALVFSIYFPPEPAGGSTLARNRAITLRKIGYLVFVVCGFPAYPSGRVLDPKYSRKLIYIEKSEDLKLIRIRLPRLRHEGYFRRLIIFFSFLFLSTIYMSRIKKETGKIDILYAVAPILLVSFVGLIYSLFTKALLVYEAPDVWPEQLIPFDTPLLPVIMSVGKFFAKLCYSFPDIIIATSTPMAEYIRRQYSPRAPVRGVPGGVDPSRFPCIPKGEARDFLIRNKILSPQLRDKFILLYAGVITRAQRIENLLYAARDLTSCSDIAFLIVGEGEDRDKIVDFKQRYNLDNVLILPFQREDIVPYIFSAADVGTVVINPEHIFELIVSTKLYVYLACHKPVIGICKGEVDNIIKSNRIGYTAVPGDVGTLVSIIDRLRHSQSEIRSLQENTYQALGKYSLDKVATLLREALGTLEK